MAAQERREKLKELLQNAPGPLSASGLAKQLGVSRQIVVGDVALLRAGGCDIRSTPRGYVSSADTMQGCREMVACCHTGEEQLRQELYFCRKHGVDEHIHRRGLDVSVPQYTMQLLGRVNYVLQITPDNAEMRQYKEWLTRELMRI